MCDPCFKYGRPPPPPQPSSNAAPVPNATRTLRPTNRPAEGQHRAALHLPLCPTEDGRDTLPRLEYRLQVPRQRQEAEGGQLDSTSTGSSAARCDDRQGSTPHHIGRCGCICTGMDATWRGLITCMQNTVFMSWDGLTVLVRGRNTEPKKTEHAQQQQQPQQQWQRCTKARRGKKERAGQRKEPNNNENKTRRNGSTRD